MLDEKTHKLEKKELMILFNALFDLNQVQATELMLTVPILGDPVFFKMKRYDDMVILENFISQEHYNKFKKSLISNMKNKKFSKEIPDYKDLTAAFFQAGILEMDGIQPFMKLVEDIKHQDVTLGGDVYYIAFDTNLLRDRFFSNTMKKLPYHPNIDYILCSTVRDELMNRDDKITYNDINNTYPLNHQFLRNCFLNQNRLEDRLRNIGFQEYNRMRSDTSCEEIDSPTFRSGTKNDQSILEAYSEFVEIGRKVIFLSRDNEAVRMMKGENNVIPFLIEQYAVETENTKTSWDNFFEFIYILGILFGVLLIRHPNGLSAALHGIWMSKDAQDWENELIRLRMEKNGKSKKRIDSDFIFLNDRLSKHLSVLNKLGELKEI